MRIMYLRLEDGEKLDGWIKAKELSDTTMRDFINSNLRELFQDEVVLDVETKLQAKDVRKRLIQEGLYFTEWDTGSRGKHFHLYFKDMDKLIEKERILYREYMIKKYNTDLAKRTGFIAMEYKPHLKTGNIKLKVFEREGLNELDKEIMSKVKRRIKLKEIREQLQKKKKITIDKTDVKSLKQQIKPTDLWMRWGLTKKGNRWDTPFAVSKSKASVWLQDDKNFWYDFHIDQGGDIITAVQMKYGITFKEALEKLKTGEY